MPSSVEGKYTCRTPFPARELHESLSSLKLAALAKACDGCGQLGEISVRPIANIICCEPAPPASAIFLRRGLGRAATADPLRGSAEIFQDLIGDKSHGVGLPAPWLQFRLRLFERAPRLFCSGTAVVQAAATECVPGRDQRLKAVPPIGVNVAATALEQHIFPRTAKPELHRQGVALLRLPTSGHTVRILSHAKATAMMVNCNNPAHIEILSVSCWDAAPAMLAGALGGWLMPPPGRAAAWLQAACWPFRGVGCPVQRRSSPGQAAALPPM